MLLEIKTESMGLARKFSVVHERDDIDLNQGSASEGGERLNKKDIFELELQDLVHDYVSALKRWRRTPKCHSVFLCLRQGINIRGETEYNHCIKLHLFFLLFFFSLLFFPPILSHFSVSLPLSLFHLFPSIFEDLESLVENFLPLEVTVFYDAQNYFDKEKSL